MARTILTTGDLKPSDFAQEGELVMIHPTAFGFKGPYELGGDIADYENQSGRQELVWKGGSVQEPSCAWIVWPDDTHVKIKEAGQNTGLFCEAVLNCVATDVNKGAGEPDCYLIPEMDGPTWRVVSVEWVDVAAVSTDFSTDIGTDLASLVVALNASENLPDGWEWKIMTSQLALCVPHGTTMTKAVLEGGEESDFTDGPDIEGSSASTLGESIVIEQTFSGSGGFAWSANTTEATIEAQFALNDAVQVRWTDADGDERVSYKDPVNGWYHPAEKMSSDDPIVFVTSSEVGVLEDLTTDSFDYEAAGIPLDVKFLWIRLFAKAKGQSGEASIRTSNVDPGNRVRVDVGTDDAHENQNSDSVISLYRVSGGSFGYEYEYDLSGSALGEVKGEILGWKR